MLSITDRFYALRFLRLLTTPWEKTNAFKAGIIDANGKVLKKAKGKDKKVYNIFHKLVYNLKRPDDIYRRFPGIDGSLYLAAGVSLNYQAINKIVLAPIRTGLGLRAGASIGYLHYNQEHSWLPF